MLLSRSLICIYLVAACGHPHDSDGRADASGTGGDDGAVVGDGGGGGGDGGGGDDGGGGSAGDAGAGSGSGSVVPALCDAHHWSSPIAVAGPGIMRFRGKTYVFAQAGLVWAVVDHATGTAVTSAIPLPSGVTAMQAVKTELGLDGMPVVWFMNANHDYATRFDGSAFSAPIDLAGANTVHADAQGNVYAYGSTGLVEFPANGGASIARGTFPISTSDTLAWNIGVDGTVYVLQHVRRASTIHPGDQADDMKLLHLPHGSLTWSSAQLITSNEGYGFYRPGFTVAPDGSLHAAYMLGGVQAYRSHDGITWESARASDYASTATEIDIAPGNEHIDPPDRPQDVNGYVHLMAAQDYDHVAITLAFATSSLYTSSYYELRRCAPFIGSNMTWPAERFAFAESDTGEASIDERGLASIMTPFGLRVDVAP